MSLQIARESVAEISEAALVVDLSGMIMAYNTTAAEFFGWRPGAKVGSQFRELIADQPTSMTLRHFLEESTGRSRQIKVPSASGSLIAATSTITKRPVGTEMAYRCTLIEVHHEDASLEALSEFEQLTAHLPGVLFKCDYGRERNISFISETIEAFCGYRSQDLVAGEVSYSDLMSEEDEIAVWATVGESFRANTSYTAEYRIVHVDGSTTWVTENGRVVSDARGIPRFIVGSIADNQAIKTAAVEFEGTVTALSRASAVVEFDLDGHILSVNDNFLNLTGYVRQELVGHYHSILTPSATQETEEYREFWDRLREGEAVSGEFLRMSKTGQEVWIQATYNPIFDSDGHPYKIVKFANDLTERREMEAELRIAMEQAEHAVKARGSFVANMSHEIRTPMNAVIGFTEALLDTKIDAQQERYLRLVLNSSRSLLRLLNEVLDQSKLDRGAVELEYRTFSIIDLGEQVTSSLHVGASNKQLKLECVIDDSVPRYLHGDSLRIQQVYLNLLSNAIKFTEEGRVALEISYEDGNLISVISDTGVGMAPEYLERLFEPYSQSDSSTSRRHGGTGLGTAISLQLVELMGGTIDVESELGVGTAFTITLPIKEGSEQDTRDDEIEVDLPVLNILCADDIPANLELLELTLGRYGHSIVSVADGVQMLAAYKAGNFDIVLSDLQMPGMDGYEASSKIRSYERENNLKKVPIIALSAHVLEEYRQRAYAAGMDGFAFKPLDPRGLKLEMARVLGLSDKQKQPEVLSDVQAPLPGDGERDTHITESHKYTTRAHDDTETGAKTSDIATHVSDGSTNKVGTSTGTGAPAAGAAAGAGTDGSVGGEAGAVTGDGNIDNTAGSETEISESDESSGADTRSASVEGSESVTTTSADVEGSEQDLDPASEDTGSDVTVVDNVITTDVFSRAVNADEATTLFDIDSSQDSDTSPSTKAQSSASAGEPAIDWDAGLALWGDREILARSINSFVKTNEEACEEILEAVEADNGEDGAAIAHRVCGAAGNLRLRNVQQISKQLETSIRAGGDDIIDLIDELDTAMAAVRSEIEAEIQSQVEASEADTKPKVFTPEQVEEIDNALAELSEALKGNRLSDEALDDLEPLIPSKDMQELHAQLDAFNFTSALEIVEEMKARFVKAD